MKKQLEKELQELAQNIISTKDNLDLPELKKELEKLLEKVSILNFVEKYYNSVGSSEDRLQYTMKKVADFIEEEQDENDIFNLPVETTKVQKIVLSQTEKTSVEAEKIPSKSEESQVAKTSYTAESPKTSAYKAYQDIVQKAHTHQETEKQHTHNETIAEEQPKPAETKQVAQKQSLEDFISQTQHPVFEKKEEAETAKTPSLNDRLGKTAQIGLNDRLAFIRQLFFGSESEYNTVVQHINDLQSVEEIALYIEQEIKPIYNHWRGKEDYEERFLGLMLKRFEI
ncbi:hypothetical protein CAPN001_12850 [Capnocytophaga stomatis]|uniref:hypothetical protein n=1 Tax=Capnocytophaga stomatis TaxID=1848904 RepID=UPI00194FFB63|nr:hypothetical protein [Capnocytophaga stomatis]GIJ96716.1 hypothetical protein CAPN001_12850 [Capnocytophaga stomatis]GIM48654.1 hypothetical protein CAPN003_01060 [Capnocytophaga stomatis]